ncbi:MAG: D-2-hydroxyacid dehydrogenase [Myxococcaceae bacterium]|nr:D-2-hydroxyacid dehydrogenase [Myxococcaceae bacterium]MCI0673630.1 D-2-hydroxyacid dehydrogenase [Myxococcaceae bacterium]
MNTPVPLNLFCDTDFPEDAERLLREGTAGHRLLRAAGQRSNLAERGTEPALQNADVAFGQPAVADVLDAPRLRWVHLTSAGYTRYDTEAFRQAARQKGLVLTTSSSVYADPCAEHVLAMMLSLARRLPDSLDSQRGSRDWQSEERRVQSFLLRGQTVLLLGYGAIGRRLAQLLAPFEVRLFVFRRTAAGGEPGRVLREEELDGALAEVDHVVDLLPENEATRGFLSAARLARLRTGACVYNVGRGSTVDEQALLEALHAGRLGGVYLDVTQREPLPKDHPLWSAPRCYVTPHSAGGRREEHLALVEHFLANLRRFERGEPLADRVV